MAKVESKGPSNASLAFLATLKLEHRVYITDSELTEMDQHGWTGDILQLIDQGFVIVAESLTQQEKEKAG